VAELGEPERVREPLRRVDRADEHLPPAPRRREAERGRARRLPDAARAAADQDLPGAEDLLEALGRHVSPATPRAPRRASRATRPQASASSCAKRAGIIAFRNTRPSGILSSPVAIL